jgi:hypothetical protein
MAIARHKALSARRRRTECVELDEKIEATIADPANNPELALQEKDRGEYVENVRHFIAACRRISLALAEAQRMSIRMLRLTIQPNSASSWRNAATPRRRAA